MELKSGLTLSETRTRLRSAGQEHLLHFYAELDPHAQRALIEQIATIELERLPRLIDQYVRHKQPFTLPTRLEPAPYYARDARSWNRDQYRAKGEELLRAGKIAAFTVAGGQGTRLGFDGPKGTYFGTAVTRKPLFRCLAEWILSAHHRFQKTIPWYIMTSPLNHAETVAFFQHHAYFGLSERDVMFFSQGVLPSLDLKTGNLLLSEKGMVATNPDGHGGSLRALWTSGAIDDMKRRGVEHLSYVQIDNPLARVIDPVFIGLHAAAPDSSAEMSSKMVAKSDPAEKVGVFCRADAKTQVIEYSDLPREKMEERDPSGNLRFNAGSIAIHMISVDFVSRLNAGGELSLPLHRAEKKVPFVDPATGNTVQPTAPNAVKLEAFVFDALPLCRSSIVYETDRIDEFAPIKNADGNDSPATCRDIQTERAARWLEARGVLVPRSAVGKPECTIEISPLTAWDAQDLSRLTLPPAIPPNSELTL
ncbi:MAG: UDPGP type 1 family protein [Phycisphaerae bacterium]|nr:UDPGP type 1 family protein [Phycisphaerae bacterium]